MSLVGTRPPTLDEWEKYEPHHRARMSFRPGLTGLWQVSGRSNITDFEEVVKLDTKYISEWSVIFLSDSVDYGEVMNGTREESVIFSMQTFTVKLASGVAVFLAGLVVDWIHLDTAAAVQTQDTLDALRMWMTIPSVILLIVGIFVFKRFYKLDDTRMEEIKSKLN